MKLNININLDGNRPTLASDESGASTLSWFVYNNGFYGENNDFTPDLCSGVLVRLNHVILGVGLEEYTFLDDVTAAELKLLKTCLGDADGDATNNVDVNNWDYGDASNPHLIKLIDATQDDLQYADTDPTHYVPTKFQTSFLCRPNVAADFVAGTGANVSNPYVLNQCKHLDPAGFYAAIFWDNTAGRFKVYGRPHYDYAITTDFHVYTSKGYLNLVSDSTAAFNTWGSSPAVYSNEYLLTNKLFTVPRNGITGARAGVDCETSSASVECLQKDDWMMVLNTGNNFATGTYSTPAVVSKNYVSNPIYAQLYQVKKISNEEISYSDYTVAQTYSLTANTYPQTFRNQIVLDKVVNAHYHLDGRLTAPSTLFDTSASLFKFYPPVNKYEYAAQCSNRGICDKNSGLCQCFGGFTGDNCQRIDALAA